jgi:hypothetical protein
MLSFYLSLYGCFFSGLIFPLSSYILFCSLLSSFYSLFNKFHNFMKTQDSFLYHDPTKYTPYFCNLSHWYPFQYNPIFPLGFSVKTTFFLSLGSYIRWHWCYICTKSDVFIGTRILSFPHFAMKLTLMLELLVMLRGVNSPPNCDTHPRGLSITFLWLMLVARIRDRFPCWNVHCSLLQFVIFYRKLKIIFHVKLLFYLCFLQM